MESTAAGASAGGAGSDCEGEDPEDSSSSHSNEPLEEVFINLTLQDNAQDKDNEDELRAFRQQWQRELESTPAPSPKREPPKLDPPKPIEEPQSEEERAKQLFLRGVEFERAGKLYEAIQHYKRAMQILPDVETRLYESSDLRADSPEEESEPEEQEVAEVAPLSDDSDAEEGEQLVTRLQRVVARRNRLCECVLPNKGAHISWLPYEVILLILRWVVSSELDAMSLERVAAVCRGLYVAAREPDLWRSLCVKTWGIDCGSPRAHGFDSWRQMFIQRPRLHVHGCYISKTTYLRYGENSFQDHFYRPWYIIDYYRYLRFFPEGVVLMWTTEEEPAACVSALRVRAAARSVPGVLAGHWRLVGDKVAIVIKKQSADKKTQAQNTRFRPRRKENETHDQTQNFHLELELRSVRARRNFQLLWSRYSVSTRREQWSQFELSPAKYPPFAFSRVRAYTAEAHAPLPHTHSHS
ncbi:F-box only protein 9 isoform X2 [Pectinophora gossypiella]|nr:F-box only protein 9 isoform X2 [Pectinophora gossypiella]